APISPIVSISPSYFLSLSFFFNDTATTELYTLSLHDALPIFASMRRNGRSLPQIARDEIGTVTGLATTIAVFFIVVVALAGLGRSEEHTSELQSRFDLVCRLLLEKKKKIIRNRRNYDIKQTYR